jgi:hypothetical protein
MVKMKERLTMFESVFGTGHTGPWRVHCRIPSQDQTGTYPRTAAAAPQNSPASANPMVHRFQERKGNFQVRF